MDTMTIEIGGETILRVGGLEIRHEVTDFRRAQKYFMAESTHGRADDVFRFKVFQESEGVITRQAELIL